jgi:hypothetical protein
MGERVQWLVGPNFVCAATVQFWAMPPHFFRFVDDIKLDTDT